MPNYRRYRIPGGCYFFTVNLLEREKTLLVDNIDRLRESVRITKQRYPFYIDACVILPDHLHCIWTLPQGDSDFSGRWREIKKLSAKPYPRQKGVPKSEFEGKNEVSGNGDFGSMQSVMMRIMFITTWLSMAGWSTSLTGRIRHFIAGLKKGFI